MIPPTTIRPSSFGTAPNAPARAEDSWDRVAAWCQNMMDNPPPLGAQAIPIPMHWMGNRPGRALLSTLRTWVGTEDGQRLWATQRFVHSGRTWPPPAEPDSPAAEHRDGALPAPAVSSPTTPGAPFEPEGADASSHHVDPADRLGRGTPPSLHDLWIVPDPADPDGLPPAVRAAFEHTRDWTPPSVWSGTGVPLTARVVRQAVMLLIHTRPAAAWDRWANHPVWALAKSNAGHPVVTSILVAGWPDWIVRALHDSAMPQHMKDATGLVQDPHAGTWRIADPRALGGFLARYGSVRAALLVGALRALPGLAPQIDRPDNALPMLTELLRQRCIGPAAWLLTRLPQGTVVPAGLRTGTDVALAMARPKAVPVGCAPPADSRGGGTDPSGPAAPQDDPAPEPAPPVSRTGWLLADLWRRWGVPDVPTLRAVLGHARVSNPDAPDLLELVLSVHHPEAPTWEPAVDDPLLLATGLRHAKEWLGRKVRAGWTVSDAAWRESGMGHHVETRAAFDRIALTRVGATTPAGNDAPRARRRL